MERRLGFHVGYQPRLSNPRFERRGRNDFMIRYHKCTSLHPLKMPRDVIHTHTHTTPPPAIMPGNPYNYKLTTNHTATVLYHACLRTQKITLRDDPRNKSDQIKSNRIFRSTISLYLNPNLTIQGGGETDQKKNATNKPPSPRNPSSPADHEASQRRLL